MGEGEKECEPPMSSDGRNPACVEAWADCESFGYDPRCCRFPKTCSCDCTVEAIDG